MQTLVHSTVAILALTPHPDATLEVWSVFLVLLTDLLPSNGETLHAKLCSNSNNGTFLLDFG